MNAPLFSARRSLRPEVWTCEVAAALTGGGIEIVAAALDINAEPMASLADLLCESERERARRFIFERDRRRFIVARARLRQLLAARLNTLPEALDFAYGEHGKPALASREEVDLRFNVSHSEDVAVYAFAAGRDVGVDVEALRPMADAPDIARSAFSAAERRAFLALAPVERTEGFFNCWTRKEAFIKALGEGLSHPLDAFDVSLAPGEPARMLRVGGIDGGRCGWDLHSFSPRPGFVGAVVVRA
jgi:4'-phosphopantetheinyl transferase